jgi:hypothetical protein
MLRNLQSKPINRKQRKPQTPSSDDWKLSGNAHTKPDAHFLGTTDKKPLVIKTNGNEQLRVTETGNIGIGTASPIGKLTVRASGYGVMHTDGTITAGSWVGSGANAEGGWLGTQSNHPLYFFTNDSGAKMTLGVNGNLGIGTTEPNAKLTVQSRGYGLLHSDETVSVGTWVDRHGGWLGTRSNHPLHFFTNDGGASMTLGVDGHLGIGTPPEAYLVTIAGSVRIDSRSTFPLMCISTSAPAIYAASRTGDGIEASSYSGVGVRAYSNIGNIVEGHSRAGSKKRTRRFHIDNNGVYIAGSDFAEALPGRGDKASYEPGDVLVLSETEPGTIELSQQPYDHRVVGVYSTRPAVLGADKGGESRVDFNELPVAILGIVPTKVSVDNGPIQPGDLLTTSNTRGHAMKATLPALQGTVIGKALDPLREGIGTIRVLVTLR